MIECLGIANEALRAKVRQEQLLQRQSLENSGIFLSNFLYFLEESIISDFIDEEETIKYEIKDKVEVVNFKCIN